MKLNTMAAVMSFVTRIEEDAASFYEECATQYPNMKDTLLSWSKENRKFEKDVKRTYFGVITDTLESNYAFEGLDTDDYAFGTSLSTDAEPSDVAKQSQDMEEKIKGFYLRAAELSEGLMADIPRLFRKIAKKRENRRIPV
jgi:hypothetical protein